MEGGRTGTVFERLLTSALSRSDTPLGLTVKDGRTQDLVASGELRRLATNPKAYFIEYRDGLRATVLMLDGAIQDFIKKFPRASQNTHPVLKDPPAQRHPLRLPHAQGGGDDRLQAPPPYPVDRTPGQE